MACFPHSSMALDTCARAHTRDFLTVSGAGPSRCSPDYFWNQTGHSSRELVLTSRDGDRWDPLLPQGWELLVQLQKQMFTKRRTFLWKNPSHAHAHTARRARVFEGPVSGRQLTANAVSSTVHLPLPPCVHGPFATHRKRPCCRSGVPAPHPRAVMVTLTHLPRDVRQL